VLAFINFLWRYARRYQGSVGILVLALLCENAFAVVVPLCFQLLVDAALNQSFTDVLPRVSAGLVLGLIAGSIAGVGRDYVFARLGARILNDIRLEMFDHLQRLSMSYYSRTQIGDIVARFSTDLGALQSVIVYSLPYFAFYLIGSLLSTAFLFLLDWRLALVATVGLPLTLLGPNLMGPKATAASLRVREDESKVASAVQENAAAQIVIKAFRLQTLMRERFVERLEQLLLGSVRFRMLSSAAERAPGVSVNILQLIVIAYGAWLVSRDEMSVGSLVAFNGLFLNVTWGVNAISDIILPFLGASGGMLRIKELLDQPPQVTDLPDASPLPRLNREISFRHVSFAYGPERHALRDVSFTIPHGTSVAFVGPSGSGKSTVISLLARLHDPTEGTLRVDGRDLRAAQQDSLRAQIGMVLQDNILFSTTIRENIQLGQRDGSNEQVEAAAKAAGVHEAILALPEGYDTPVGERGGQLSGGQRQRVAIARAVMGNPSILILDEATSALDPATEAAVSAALSRVARGRTVVSVTHRLATIVDYDCIYVLQDGQLMEHGRHEDLLRLDGVYANLWQRQQGFALSQDGFQASVAPQRLRSIPIFSPIDDDSLAELSANLVTEQVPEQRMVIHQGDVGDKFYVVVRGKVEVIHENSAGEEDRLAVLQDGDHFGEIALLHQVVRTASVRTITPCIFLSLQRGQFERLLSHVPNLRETLEAIEIQRAAFADGRRGASLEAASTGNLAR
jgi:ATP-binding cassette, subfamily B, bacterial